MLHQCNKIESIERVTRLDKETVVNYLLPELDQIAEFFLLYNGGLYRKDGEVINAMRRFLEIKDQHACISFENILSVNENIDDDTLIPIFEILQITVLYNNYEKPNYPPRLHTLLLVSKENKLTELTLGAHIPLISEELKKADSSYESNYILLTGNIKISSPSTAPQVVGGLFGVVYEASKMGKSLFSGSITIAFLLHQMKTLTIVITLENACMH